MKEVYNIQTDDIYSLRDSRVDIYINTVINVKSFGAKGDGITDDTESIINAINSLEENSCLFFPSGDYIVYNDYENNHHNFGYDYNKLIKIANKKNISIIGESKYTTKIRPSYQKPSSSKYNYPCTLSIIESENIEIKNITIESKGESYGDTDAITFNYGTDDRKKAIACNGGQPLLILLSDNIFVHNINARICGSVGVIYVCNSKKVWLSSIFVNAMSLGYGGICQDMFYGDMRDQSLLICNDIIQHKETIYEEEEPRVLKGSQIYSGKCCFLNEGNQNCDMVSTLYNFDIADCYGGSPDFEEGFAIGVANANTFISNVNIRDCYYALSLRNVYNGYKTVASNINSKTKIAGVFIKEDVSNTSKLELLSSRIECDGSFIPTDSSIECIKYGSALCSKSFQGKEVTIRDCTLIGTKKVVYFPHNIAILKVKNCIIEGETGLDLIGGNLNLIDNLINFTNLGMLINTTDSEGVVTELSYEIINNVLTGDSGQESVQILNTNGGDLVKSTMFKNNDFIKCYCNGNNIKGNIEDIGQQLYLKGTSIAGSYYVLEFDPITALINPATVILIDDDGNIHKSINGATYENGVIKYYFNSDIRSNFTIGNIYLVLYYFK